MAQIVLWSSKAIVIQTWKNFESLQEADDRELPLIPLVFDILKTPAVW